MTLNLGCPRKGKINLNLGGGVSDNVGNAVTDSKSKYLKIPYIVAERERITYSQRRQKVSLQKYDNKTSPYEFVSLFENLTKNVKNNQFLH